MTFFNEKCKGGLNITVFTCTSDSKPIELPKDTFDIQGHLIH